MKLVRGHFTRIKVITYGMSTITLLINYENFTPEV